MKTLIDDFFNFKCINQKIYDQILELIKKHFT